MAGRMGLEVEFVPGDWRHGVDPADVERRLREDQGHAIKAVMVVHNETSTGVTSRIGEIRAAIDRAGHPALFMVDTISSLASVEYKHDAWGVDVTVAGSQKGLMLPPGLGFNAVSKKALEAAQVGRDAAVVLGLAGDAGSERDRLFPVHAGHEPSVRAARGDRDAARGGAGARVRAPCRATAPRPAPRCGPGGSRCWRSTRANTARC